MLVLIWLQLIGFVCLIWSAVNNALPSSSRSSTRLSQASLLMAWLKTCRFSLFHGLAVCIMGNPWGLEHTGHNISSVRKVETRLRSLCPCIFYTFAVPLAFDFLIPSHHHAWGCWLWPQNRRELQWHFLVHWNSVAAQKDLVLLSMLLWLTRCLEIGEILHSRVGSVCDLKILDGIPGTAGHLHSAHFDFVSLGTLEPARPVIRIHFRFPGISFSRQILFGMARFPLPRLVGQWACSSSYWCRHRLAQT